MCADCHTGKNLIIGTEHDLNVTAPDAMNLEGKKVEESGICGQCHQIHNAPGKLYLWARELGGDDIAINGLCKSCHTDNKIGEQKQPRRSNHPNDIKVWSQKLRTRYGRKSDKALPVYDENGNLGSMGAIACSTCHDAHKCWAGNDKKGPGKILKVMYPIVSLGQNTLPIWYVQNVMEKKPYFVISTSTVQPHTRKAGSRDSNTSSLTGISRSMISVVWLFCWPYQLDWCC